ncbi:MAG: MCE family protein [Candidatus Omnitrophica bacterium]|nr:MCE family protein [Candidatus Omnitrophota bacterium]
MPRETNLEWKVGVFVTLAIACLVIFISSISDFSVFKKGSTYTVFFYYANGLKKSAPVRLSGVDAGHVQDLKVFYDTSEQKTRVAVTLWLSEGVQFPVDSRFLINQLGILGEKYLEIMPGIQREFASPGVTLVGDEPVSMESLTKELSSLGGKVEETLAMLNTGFLNNANKESLASALSNVAFMTRKINADFLTDANKQSLSVILANMAAVTGKINSSSGTIGKLLDDPSVYKNLDEMTADLKINPWKLFYRPKGQ